MTARNYDTLKSTSSENVDKDVTGVGTVRRATKKFFGTITHVFASLISCYPNAIAHLRGKGTKEPVFDTELQDIPNEIILHILAQCDFSSKMNMRAVNRRFHSLVDECAHVFPRRELIGGVEIGTSTHDLHLVSTGNGQGESSSSSGGTTSPQLTLRRPLKRMEILLPATRLTNIMRHVCVCHSLNLRNISLDETLARHILDASFRAISDLIVDRVHSVTAETLTQLVKKVYPSNSLHLHNHSSVEASDVIRPDLLTSCPARHVAIESNVQLIHNCFDDASLVRVVVSDVAIRRAIRLPQCAITHHGINDAALAFHRTCCELIHETTDEMQSPVWEVSVSLPRSVLIDRSQICIPDHMREHCVIWGHLPPHRDSFTVEVRVESMNLRIMVEARP